MTLSSENPYLDDPERPIYAVCRLMRQLPDDITNVGMITKDQSLMAAAVSEYAHAIVKMVDQGLEEIEKLRNNKPCNENNLDELLQHLRLESEFMVETAQDYFVVSIQICRR